MSRHRSTAGGKPKDFSPLAKLVIVIIVFGGIAVGYWALSATGLTLFNLTLNTQAALEQGLLLHYTFDGKDFDESQAGAQVRDRSSNAKHGNAIFPPSAAPISLSRVQFKDSTAADPASATFDAAPTSGNLLVFVCMDRSTIGGTTHYLNFVIGGDGTGAIMQMGRSVGSNTSDRRSFAAWTKISNGTETNAITCDDGTSNSKRMQISEFSAGAGATWTFMASSTNDTGTGSASPLSTGSTESVAAGDLFVLGAAIWRQDSGALSDIGWTNGLTDIVNLIGGGNGHSISTAWVHDTAGGTKESEVSWSGTGHEASNGIMVMSVTAPGGGGAAAATTTPGRIGQALQFDGVNDYVLAGDIDGGGANVRTVAFWMKAATTTASHSLVNLDLSDGSRIVTDASGNITATGFTSPTIYVNGSSASANIPDLSWHHVVVTTTTGLNADDFAVASTTAGIRLFGGAIDDVRVYERVLSPDEVTRLYQLGATTRINTTINTQPSLETGLAGHWTFDGKDMEVFAATGQVKDRSGNGNHGTISGMGTGTTTAPGRIGQALSFDGTDDHILISSDLGINAYPFTVCAWVKTNTLTGDHVIFSLNQSGTTNVLYGLALNGNVIAAFSRNTTVNPWTGAITITANKWHHVCGVWQSDTSRLLYVDNNFDSEFTTSVSFNSNTNQVYMSRLRSTDSIQFWDGQLDDIRVYNRALSPDEITRLYQLGATTKINTTLNTQPTLETGLAGHWTFDGKDMDIRATSNQVKDRSGQGNHGSISGMGAGTTTAPGRIGQGLKFDGTDDYIQTPSEELKTLNDFSLSVWFKTDVGPGAAARQMILWQGKETGDGWGNSGSCVGTEAEMHLTIGYVSEGSGSSNDGVGFYIGDSTPSGSCPDQIALFHNFANPADQTGWHHAVVTASNLGTSPSAELYIDGVLVHTDTGTAAEIDRSSFDTALRIGRPGAATRFFKGLIDDVRVYDRPLSADEVKALYNLGR